MVLTSVDSANEEKSSDGTLSKELFHLRARGKVSSFFKLKDPVQVKSQVTGV